MAILDIRRQSISWLIAEFFVVVLGVGVALTADSWREDYNNRIIESDYLTRLLVDLRQDKEILGRALEGVETQITGTSALIEYLEGKNPLVDDNMLIEYFMQAASTSSNVSERYRNDTTYTELISTGNLNLIRDTTLRTEINEYYSIASSNLERRAQLTTAIWTKFRMLTGENSGRMRAFGEIPSGAMAERLINELNTNEDIVQDFRLLRANLSNFIDGYPRQIAEAEQLIAGIQRRLSN